MSVCKYVRVGCKIDRWLYLTGQGMCSMRECMCMYACVYACMFVYDTERQTDGLGTDSTGGQASLT